MTRWRLGFGLMLVCCIVAVVPAPAVADETPACSVSADLYGAHQFCHYSGDEFHVLVSTQSDGVTYWIKSMCEDTLEAEVTCINPLRCMEPPDTYQFMVFRNSPGNAPEAWGTVCLDTTTATHFDIITPGKVYEQMKALTWPEAALVIQPPNGRTLINLPTNFLTTTTAPTTQTITLFGHRVEIEATPIDYVWHFGDGATQDGADPGAAYPDLRITHAFRRAGETVHPSVDVTYGGRFRVDGKAWIAIPDTLTVPGEPVDLQVLSATPHLVG